MNATVALAAGAFGLGLLTAIQPCLLSSHLATLGVLGGASARRERVWRVGVALAAGFATAFALLGVLLGSGLATVPRLAPWLNMHLTQLLGPLLVLVGMQWSGLLSGGAPVNLQRWFAARLPAAAGAPLWAFPLGMLLALCFCPATAALFFGVVMPGAIAAGHPVLLALCYSLGILTPLLIISVAAASRAGLPEQRNDSSRLYLRLTPVFGAAVIGVGILQTLRQVYHVW